MTQVEQPSFTEKLREFYLKIKYRYNYHEYYAKLMKVRTQNDPKNAIGGLWDEMGKLQFNYLLKHGLQPESRLLDFGCGALRGGLHYIRYLNAGNYEGIDISEDILKEGRKFLKEANLETKNPALHLVNDLSFDCVNGKTFDFIIAQSVLSHMPLKEIETSFSNIKKVMKTTTIYFATFHDGGDKTFVKEFQDFYFPFADLQNAGKRSELKIELMNDYPHPRNQRMMKITLQ